MTEKNRYSPSASNLIWVNFRGKSLSIDNDDYLGRVTEIHCRVCNQRRPRKGAMEFVERWGYLCEACRKETAVKARISLHERGNKNDSPVESGPAKIAG